MNGIVVFMAGGHAFYAGLILILAAAVALSLAPPGKLVLGTRAAVVFLSLILIALSATPLPEGTYTFLFIVMIAWVAAEIALLNLRAWLFAMRGAVVVTCAAVGAAELRYTMMPDMPLGSSI